MQIASLSPSEKEACSLAADEKGTVPRGSRWGVSNHSRQLRRRQLSSSHSGNKCSFQMFGHSELSLNKTHLNMNSAVLVGKLVDFNNCHIQFQVLAFRFRSPHWRLWNSAARRKPDSFIFVQFIFYLCSRWSLVTSNKASNHIIYKQSII